MKKFLKTLFILLLAIVFIPIVNAEDLEYEWGKYFRNSDYISYTFVRDYGYDVFSYDQVMKVDKDGNELDSIPLDLGYNLYVGYDDKKDNYVALSYESKYIDSSYKRYLMINILNSDFEIIDEYEEEVEDYFYPDYMNAADTEYAFINVENGSVLAVNKNFTSWELLAYNDLTKEEIKGLWGEYSIIEELVSNSSNPKYYYRYDKNDKGYRLLQYDRMLRVSGAGNGLEIYDTNNELVYSKKYYNDFISVLSDDGFYVIEEIDIDDRKDNELCNDDTECSSYNKLTKYDFYGKKIYEKDLQKMTSNGYFFKWNTGRKIIDAKYIDGSLLLISNYESNIPVSLEEEITGRNPALIKYSIIYDIETKTDGNGEIKVANRSKSGEEITYEITPKEGYVLGVVKVTDKDGNVVEYTTNKFTMPASDVTMEVTFLPKNPETKDLAMIGIVITLSIGLGMLLLNYRKLKFLK